jgi:hypothetical protein
MTGIVWVAILVGLALVIAAVGIPYLLTHKRMRSPHDRAESHEYLHKTHRQVRRDGTISAEPGSAPSPEGAEPAPASDEPGGGMAR